MAARQIVKTTLTVTILHYADEPLADSLAGIAEELDVGFMLGQITGEKTEEIAPEDVLAEERKLAGDGSFFAAFEADDEDGGEDSPIPKAA